MRIAVVGGRTITNYFFMKDVLDKHSPTQIISGGANGADTLAYHYARQRGITFLCHPPLEEEKTKMGFARSAKRRNLRILAECDLLIAFPSKESKGTYHTIYSAKRMKIPVEIYNE